MADENQANVTYLNPPSLERSPGYRQEMRAPNDRRRGASLYYSAMTRSVAPRKAKV